DVVGAESIVPGTDPESAGGLVARPERLLDDVPGLALSHISRDDLLDIGIEEFPPFAGTQVLDPVRIPFVPDQAVPAHRDAVLIAKCEKPVGTLEMLGTRLRRDPSHLQ